jgi:hypothetical protein
MPRPNQTRKTGAESFTLGPSKLPFNLLDFWQWSVSDLISNLTRARLAEYIVAKACDIPTSGIRDEWQAFDLITADGIKIEVKAGGYIQSWTQKKPSVLRFDCRETLAWSAELGTFDATAKRQADIYVFAIHKHLAPATINPLNLDQWEFYIVHTEELNRLLNKSRSISLRAIKSLSGSSVPFVELGLAVARLGLNLPPECGDCIEIAADGIRRIARGPNSTCVHSL